MDVCGYSSKHHFTDGACDGSIIMVVYIYICDGGVQLKLSLLILIIAENCSIIPTAQNGSQGLISLVHQHLPLRYYYCATRR